MNWRKAFIQDVLYTLLATASLVALFSAFVASIH
jgi:hypothetical protein